MIGTFRTWSRSASEICDLVPILDHGAGRIEYSTSLPQTNNDRDKHPTPSPPFPMKCPYKPANFLIITFCNTLPSSPTPFAASKVSPSSLSAKSTNTRPKSGVGINMLG
jgi:hypothetical protein